MVRCPYSGVLPALLVAGLVTLLAAQSIGFSQSSPADGKRLPTAHAQRFISVVALNRHGLPLPNTSALLIPTGEVRTSGAQIERLTTDGSGTSTGAVPKGQAYVVRIDSSWLGEILSVELNGNRTSHPVVVPGDVDPAVVTVTFSDVGVISGRITFPSGAFHGSVYLSALGSKQGNCKACWSVEYDGTFAIPAASFPVVVKPINPEREWEFEPPQVVVADMTMADGISFVATARDGGKVTGRVVELGSEKPIHGASVIASWRCGKRGGSTVEAATDDLGRFKFPCERDCSYRFEVRPPEPYLSTSRSGKIHACEEQLEFPVRTGRTVEGSVRDVARSRAASLRIALRMDATTKSTTTDEDGKFEFRGVPRGAATLEIDRPSHDRGYPMLVQQNGSPAEIQIDDDSPDRISVELQLVRGGLICAAAVDRTGSRINVGLLSVFNDDGEVADRRHSSLTGGTEVCSRPLVPGHYTVQIGHERSEYIPIWWPGTIERAVAGYVEVKPEVAVHLDPMRTTPSGQLRIVRDSIPAQSREETHITLIPVPCRGSQTQSSETIRNYEVDVPGTGTTADERFVYVHSVAVGCWNLVGGSLDSERQPSFFSVEPFRVMQGESTTIRVKSRSPSREADQRK